MVYIGFLLILKRINSVYDAIMDRPANVNNITTEQLAISEATEICVRALENAGFVRSDAKTITDHLIDAELRGHPFAGLSRALSIIDHLQEAETVPSTKIEVSSDGPGFSRLDGHDVVGYLVAKKATEIAIEKAKSIGVSIVGAHDFWYSGNLAYYAEMATQQGLACIIVSNAPPLVAPHGAVEARFGTNPICIGFPTSNTDRPIIWDIGTSNAMLAQIVRAERLGTELPEGLAYDEEGNSTRDPGRALNGALTVWGGQKGSGLAVMIQLLGLVAGGSAIPHGMSGFGYLAVVFNPSVLRPLEEVNREADTYSAFLRSTKLFTGEDTVRMPFDGSHERRNINSSRGCFDIPSQLIQQLRERS